MDTIIGSASFVLSAICLALGFPIYTRQNVSESSPVSLIIIFYVSTLLMYAGWAVYGFLKGDLLICFGQVLGVLATVIMTWQFIWFKRKLRELSEKHRVAGSSINP